MSATEVRRAAKEDAFFSATLAQADPEIADVIAKELGRQRDEIELIASENIVSRAVLEAQGSVLTNKYAEGYPGRRYYGGCQFVDMAETIAIERAKKGRDCEFRPETRPRKSHPGANRAERRGCASRRSTAAVIVGPPLPLGARAAS